MPLDTATLAALRQAYTHIDYNPQGNWNQPGPQMGDSNVIALLDAYEALVARIVETREQATVLERALALSSLVGVHYALTDAEWAALQHCINDAATLAALVAEVSQ